MVNKLTTEEFIIRAELVHGKLYDYSNVYYKKSTIPVEIICSKHGSFMQRPSDHLRGGARNKTKRGCGCPECGLASRSKRRALSTEQFIERATLKHKDLYDYSLVEYENMHSHVKIICSKHGSFMQRPEVHLNGIGCPKCSVNISLGEKRIIEKLDQLGINYQTQKSFKDLFYKDKRAKLRYDFYLPEYNMLLEYHGEQHYKPINIKGRIFDEYKQAILFHHTYIKDNLKESYAESGGFIYEVIKFDECLVTKLNEILNRHRR